ncbi:MAG: hypothetical protein ACM3NQ_13150 [Bacteroidales bacterium]
MNWVERLNAVKNAMLRHTSMVQAHREPDLPHGASRRMERAD